MSRPSKHALPGMQLADRNLRFGWWALLFFLSLGAVLETLQGFKIGWYLDVGNETRRLMFTLAHAHGTLLALVNIAAGPLQSPAFSFLCINLGCDPAAGGILSRRNCHLRWRSRTGGLARAHRSGALVLQHRANRARFI